MLLDFAEKKCSVVEWYEQKKDSLKHFAKLNLEKMVGGGDQKVGQTFLRDWFTSKGSGEERFKNIFPCVHLGNTLSWALKSIARVSNNFCIQYWGLQVTLKFIGILT